MNGRRLASAVVLKLLGVGGLFVIWSAYDPAASRLAITLGTVFPSFLAIALLLAGGWLTFTDELDDGSATRVLEWSVAGMAAVGGLGLLALVLQREGYIIDHPVFVVTSTVVSGAVAGFGIGFYDVWSTRQQRELAQEREKLDHLNRLLRHHLLNGMNVMLAKIELAREETEDSTVGEELADARNRGNEIVGLVEQVSAIAGGESGEMDEIALDRILRSEVERVRAIHGPETVTVAEPLPEVSVRSRAALGEAIGVLLEDTLAAGAGRTTVSAALDGDEAVVSITTPAARPATDGGDALLGGPGSDVGLSVADVLVERSGGELVDAEAEDTVRIRLETI
jgi:hypothetical protein